MKKIIFMVTAILMSISAAAENIVSKEDADYIFTLSKDQWNDYASKLTMPGMEVRFQKTEDGVIVVSAMNTKTNIGLSIRPMFELSDNKPDLLIVVSIYPLGALIDTDRKFMKSIEVGAQEDLGAGYKVVSEYNAEEYNYETVSLFITEAK